MTEPQGVTLLTDDQRHTVEEYISGLTDQELALSLERYRFLPTCFDVVKEEIIKRWLHAHQQ